MNKKRFIGFFAGLAVAAAILAAPLGDIGTDARRCLAMSIGVILWWAFEVMPTGLSASVLLMGYSLFLDPAVAPAGLIFKFWGDPTAYMIVSGFLITAAIKKSGIGKRFALFCITRFVRNYRQIIVACYVLGYLLALIIPSAYGRAFLIMSVMEFVIENSRMERKYAINVGLAVFAAQNVSGLLFMTAESSLNVVLLSLIPEALRPSWMGWVGYMGVPALIGGVLMCGVQLLLVKSPKDLVIDVERARMELAAMGPLSGKEKRTIFWVAVAVALWMTDSLHHINVGWAALAVCAMMAVPVVGDLLDIDDVKDINFNLMLFNAASVALGVVGGATGMNSFLAARLFPSSAGGVLGLMAIIVGVCLLLHVLLGSVIAVFTVAVPALILLAEPLGVHPAAVAFAAYIVLICQWFFPYQNLTMAVGASESTGKYTPGDVTRLGLIFTLPTVLLLAVSVVWWGLLGLL